MLRIKKNDQVTVIAGKDRGKTGRVLQVFPKQGRVLVESVNLVKKARRRTQQDPQGGLHDIEASLHISNVMLIDKKTSKPARFGANILKDGTKIRVSKKSDEVI